jgi:hypothetical protein
MPGSVHLARGLAQRGKGRYNAADALLCAPVAVDAGLGGVNGPLRCLPAARMRADTLIGDARA